MPRYALVLCEDAPHWEGGYSCWIDHLREDGREEEWLVFDAAGRGEVPSLADKLDGLVLTGSHYGANDNLPWMLRLSEYVQQCYVPTGSTQEAAAARPRIVASCFGAQLVAAALGGRVESLGHFVLKAEEVVPTAALAAQPFAAGLLAAVAAVGDGADKAAGSAATSGAAAASALPTLRLLESHGDYVQTLPPDTILLATSASCPHELFLVGENMLAMQFHPEFEVKEHMIERIWHRVVEEKVRLTPAEAVEAQESFRRPQHSVAVRDMLRRFMKMRA